MYWLPLFAVLLGFPIAALWFVSNPPKGHISIHLKGKASIRCEMPRICVITGEPATEWHKIRCYGGDLVLLQKLEMEFPFSHTGWKTYKGRYPISLRLFKSGIAASCYLPLVRFPLIYVWSILTAPFLGYISFYDLWKGRQPLVVIHNLSFSVWREQLKSYHFSIMSKEFAGEFLKLNSDMSLSDYMNAQMEVKVLKIKCPNCNRPLKGVTTKMVGDTGVCNKCKTEFTIQFPGMNNP
jgi:hypothetical protein